MCPEKERYSRDIQYDVSSFEMTNGKCPSGCNVVRLGPNPSCMCPGDSYLSEDNTMDTNAEYFDSSTSEGVEMESYDEDFYAVY